MDSSLLRKLREYVAEQVYYAKRDWHRRVNCSRRLHQPGFVYSLTTITAVGERDPHYVRSEERQRCIWCNVTLSRVIEERE